MNSKTVLPMRSAWIGASLLAFFSVYFALSGFGVPGEGNRTSLTRAVSILPVPESASSSSSQTSPQYHQATTTTMASGDLVEVKSSTPVFSYSDDSQFERSHEIPSTTSGSVPESTTVPSLQKPDYSSSDSKSTTQETSSDSKASSSSSDKLQAPTSSSSVSTTTTTTVPSGGGDSSHAGSDN